MSNIINIRGFIEITYRVTYNVIINIYFYNDINNFEHQSYILLFWKGSGV